MHQPVDPKFLIVDMLCGAGGTTSGFAIAEANGARLAKIIACLNHDPVQIKSHWLNHKDVRHFQQDIRGLEIRALVALVQSWRLKFPGAKLIFWISLECTNFSRAKGGMPRDVDSRTLANELFRYIRAIDPDYIQIENVVEFMAWGPMRIKTKKVAQKPYPHTELCMITHPKTKKLVYGWEPISSRKGEDYVEWRKKICAMGYHEQWKELNCADFGAHTSRNRLFGCFARHGLPINWPQPTHSKHPKKTGLKKWEAVKEVLDLTDEGESIFNRIRNIKTISQGRELITSGKKCKIFYAIPKDPGVKPYAPLVIAHEKAHTFNEQLRRYMEKHGKVLMYYYDDLVENSLKRILAGLIKYVAGGKNAFILKYNSYKEGKYYNSGPDDPCPTIAVQNRLAACFITQRYSGKPSTRQTSIDSPARTLTSTGGNQELVYCFITKGFSGDPYSKAISVDGPAGAIKCRDGQHVVQCFLTKYYGTGDNVSSIEEPAGTVRTKDCFQMVSLEKTFSRGDNNIPVTGPAGAILVNDKHRLIQCSWIDRPFTNGGQHSSINDPAGAIMQWPKLNLVNTEPFLMNTSYDGKFTTVNEPASTLLASRRHHYPIILNPSHGGHCTSAENPCPVIVARQDKAPLYFLYAEAAGDDDNMAVPVYDNDCPTMVQIKEFMFIYKIKNIKMRMLKVQELLKIQGFPGDYILAGSQTDQKKGIGNSVPPIIPKSWCEAMFNGLEENLLVA